MAYYALLYRRVVNYISAIFWGCPLAVTWELGQSTIIRSIASVNMGSWTMAIGKWDAGIRSMNLLAHIALEVGVDPRGDIIRIRTEKNFKIMTK